MEIKLGLGSSPDRVTYLFVGESDSEIGSTPWYEWDHDGNKAIPVREDAVTGYIYNIVINQKEFKGKRNYKLNIHIQADHKYVIRCGAGTTYARGFLLSLNKLLEESSQRPLQHPLTISAQLGRESTKVVFSGVYFNGQKVIPDWDGEIPLMPLVQKIQGAMGQVVQTKEMMDDNEVYYQAQLAHREAAKQAEETQKPKRRAIKEVKK